MQPSPEAIAWGKRQASQSPHWSDAKWNRIAAILGVELRTQDQAEQKPEQDAEQWRDAA